jgi:hypothetical protein
MTACVIAPIDPELLRKARGEFLEMPGLRLTFQQAQRLWSLDASTCKCLLETLVDMGFLVLRDDRQYGRASDGNPQFPPLLIGRSGGRKRQAHGDDGSAFFRGIDDDLAMMGFNEPLDGRQPEARATGFRRHER